MEIMKKQSQPFAIGIIFPNKSQRNIKVKSQGHPKDALLDMLDISLSMDFITERDILLRLNKRKNGSIPYKAGLL